MDWIFYRKSVGEASEYSEKKYGICLKRIIRAVLDILYPPKCPFCGKIEKEGICRECREKVSYIKEPRCMKCGKPIQKATAEYCLDCTHKLHAFREGRSLWLHKKPVSDAIYALKYQNCRIYGEIFAEDLFKMYGAYLERKQIECIIPVPLHKKRKRSRGYNQAEIIAEKLGELTGIEVDTKSLMRVKSTRPQKELNDKARRVNIRGAFRVREKIRVKNVVLIDDIYTTGCTLDEAARTLYKAGAENVYFLTISIGQGF